MRPLSGTSWVLGVRVLARWAIPTAHGDSLADQDLSTQASCDVQQVLRAGLGTLHHGLSGLPVQLSMGGAICCHGLGASRLRRHTRSLSSTFFQATLWPKAT